MNKWIYITKLKYHKDKLIIFNTFYFLYKKMYMLFINITYEEM